MEVYSGKCCLQYNGQCYTVTDIFLDDDEELRHKNYRYYGQLESALKEMLISRRVERSDVATIKELLQLFKEIKQSLKEEVANVYGH